MRLSYTGQLSCLDFKDERNQISQSDTFIYSIIPVQTGHLTLAIYFINTLCRNPLFLKFSEIQNISPEKTVFTA